MKKIILGLSLLIVMTLGIQANDYQDRMLKGCMDGDAKKCYNAGSEYHMNRDYKNAVVYYKMGCDGEIAMSCYHMGSFYRKGLAVKKNIITALMYKDKACKLGEKTACQLAKTIREIGE